MGELIQLQFPKAPQPPEEPKSGSIAEGAIGRILEAEETEAELGKTALLPTLYRGTPVREDIGYKPTPSIAETAEKREDLWQEFEAADADFQKSARQISSDTFLRKEGAVYTYGTKALSHLHDSSVGMRELDISRFARNIEPAGKKPTDLEKAERIFMVEGLGLYHDAIKTSNRLGNSLEGARATVRTIHTNLSTSSDTVLHYSNVIDVVKSFLESYRMSKDISVLPAIEEFQAMLAQSAGYESHKTIPEKAKREAWQVLKPIINYTPPPDTAA